MEYHYTKDIMHVREFLGHREIDNTMLYIQLDRSLFKNLPDDSFIIRAAQTKEEAVKLGESVSSPSSSWKACSSSANENRGRSVQSRGKVHQSGRGEVFAFGRGCLPHTPIFFI